MPRAYSIDLRERVLAACEAGEGSQVRIAERYRVGERTLSGWLKAAREGGRRASRGGGAPALGRAQGAGRGGPPGAKAARRRPEAGGRLGRDAGRAGGGAE